MVRSELEFEDHHETRSKDKKERDRDDERDRDRERNREREKTRDREKERNREKEKARDRDREKEKARDREKDRLRDKDRDRDRERERERDRDRDRDEKEREWDEKERDWSRDRERDRDDKEEKERDRERERDHKEKDRERVRESSKDLEKEKEKFRDFDAKHKDKDKDKDKDKKDRGKDRGKEADLLKERKKDKDKRDRDADKEKDREKDKDKDKERDREKDRDRERDKEKEKDFEKERERRKDRDRDTRHEKEKEQEKSLDSHVERVLKDVEKRAAQESRKGKSDSGCEIAAWVNKSRNLEEQKKIEERIKAARMARLLSEQDSGEDSEDEDKPAYSGKDLSGLKVLHGIDKVMEGSAVVLTLKDRGILDRDDVNDEADELENLEISLQLSRDKAYKDAKKKPGIYEDKYQNDINAIRTVLPQYDEEMEDGMTLDETGGLNEEGRKRLEELRKKLQGIEQKAHESLSGSVSVASDFYTQDEMLQFNKPKKKKKLRKKEVLDLDAMEAEAKAEGLGETDLGSRSSSAKQAQKLEKEKAAEESRKSAYLNAYTKAVDASQKLRLGSVTDMGGVIYGGEEDDELERSLQRARQAALKKQAENGGSSSGPQAVASAMQQASEMEIETGHADDAGDRDKTAVVFTETEEFCRNIQLDEVLLRRPGAKDVFAEDDEPVEEEKPHGLDGGWMEVNEDNKAHKMVEKQAEEDPSVEEGVVEVAVGKGLSGALQLLKERGTLKETVEWGGRNMDKKKSKLIGIVDQEEKFKNREILLERVDEFGRVMTPKEAFRKLSHKFHGKGPGKMKQEKRMKQYEEEMKLKQMTSGDTPLLSMEKMREAQAKLHSPFLVISGHVQPGQTSDPGSGFATIDKESIGSLTPMLGDQKVEYFLGIKRKPEGGSMRPPLPKKPKTDK